MRKNISLSHHQAGPTLSVVCCNLKAVVQEACYELWHGQLKQNHCSETAAAIAGTIAYGIFATLTVAEGRDIFS